MADTVLYSQGGLSDIIKGVHEAGAAITSVLETLGAVNTAPGAGGGTPVPQAAGSLSGLAGITAVRAGTVSGAVSAYKSCLSGYAEYAHSLAQALSKVSGLFAGTEETLRTGSAGDDMISAGSGAAGSVSGGAAGGAGGAIMWSSWLEDFFNWFRRMRRRIESIQQINKRRMFDGEGWYGGDQGAPQWASEDEKWAYKRIIENNLHKELTDRQLEQYLQRVNHEACGYVCIVNAIFQMYEGRAAEFEKTFGFPMYSASGDFNYNTLLIDIYSSTDNHFNVNGVDTVQNQDRMDWELYDPEYDPLTDPTGFGMTNGNLEYRAETYLHEHGVDSQVTIYDQGDITTENVRDYMQDNTVSILVGKPYYMYEPDGSGGAIPYTNGGPDAAIDGGHFMTITGVETVTVDGVPREMYKVSSWGQVFYVDPGDAHGYQYYQVISHP